LFDTGNTKTAQPPAPPKPDTPIQQTVEEETIFILDDLPPSAIRNTVGAWALMNLILGIAGILLAITMGVRVQIKKRHEKKDKKHGGTYDGEDEKRKHRRLLLILSVPFLAIAGIVLFILTQDMRLTMILIDLWSPVHTILFGGEILCCIYAYKRKKDEDNNEKHTTLKHLPNIAVSRR